MKTGDEFIVEVTYVEVFGWLFHSLACFKTVSKL